MNDRYLRQKPPKSTGREYFGAAYTKKNLALGRRLHVKANDLIRTVTIFTALSIVDALNRFVLPKTTIHQLVVSGGGANNPLVMAQLSALLNFPVGARHAAPVSARPHPSSNIEVVSSSALGIPVDAKEALAFAVLAYETFHQRPSNLPSATGARHPAILGKSRMPRRAKLHLKQARMAVIPSGLRNSLFLPLATTARHSLLTPTSLLPCVLISVLLPHKIRSHLAHLPDRSPTRST